jgi:hypothetical protein
VTTVVVWSEREDDSPDRRLRDCTYASYLMALVYGGWTEFPRGIYTPEEREAFESSDSRPDETGSNLGNADEASRNRFGFELEPLDVSLEMALREPGYAIVVQGENRNLPLGHPLRRWQPTFADGHCVTVVTTPGKIRWLDPLAAMKYPGEWVLASTVLQWAYGTAYARRIRENGLVPGGYVADLYDLQRWRLPVRTPMYESPGGVEIGSGIPAGTVVTAIGVPLDRSTDASPGRNYGWRKILVNASAVMDGQAAPKFVYIRRPTGDPLQTDAKWDLFVRTALLNPESFKWGEPVPVPGTYTQAQYDAAVKAAAEEGRQVGWDQARAKSVGAIQAGPTNAP